MSLLEFVLNHSHQRAPKGIVYGPPGVGKTHFGAGTDKPLLIDCENVPPMSPVTAHRI